MMNRALLTIVVLVIAPIGIATWILAAFTIGENLSTHGDSILIGFGIALLAVALLTYLLLFSQVTERPGSHFSVILIICGTLCILGALALQVYVVSVTAEGNRRLTEIMGEQLKTNPSVRLNLDANYPKSVSTIPYFVLFAGLWLAGVGIKVGVVPGNLTKAIPRPPREIDLPPEVGAHG
jgi:hypothetical protein